MLNPAGERTAGVGQGLTIVGTVFLTALMVIALPPALPQIAWYFRSSPGVGVLAPMLVTLPGLAVALLSPFAGWLCDKYGKRRLLLVGIAIFLLAGLIPATLNDLNLILLSRFVVGVGAALLSVTGTALLADYFSDQQRRTWLTVQGFVIPPFAAAALAGAGVLAGQDWHHAFWLYGAAGVVLLAAFLFCYETAQRTQADANPAVRAPFIWRPVIWVGLVSLLIAILFNVFFVYAGLTFAAIGVHSGAQLGGFMGAASLATMLSALLFNYLSRRARPEAVCAIQIAIMGLGIVGMGAAPTVPTMFAFCVLHQLGAGMMLPTLIFWMSQILPPMQRGRGFGLLSTVLCAGQFVVPFAVGLASALGGGLRPGLVAVGAVAIACALALLLLSRLQVRAG